MSCWMMSPYVLGIGADVLLDDVTLRIGDRSGCLAG